MSYEILSRSTLTKQRSVYAFSSAIFVSKMSSHMGVNAGFGTFSFSAGLVVDFVLYVALLATLTTFVISYCHELKNVSADQKRVSERETLIAKIATLNSLSDDLRKLASEEPEYGTPLTPAEMSFFKKLANAAEHLRPVRDLPIDSALRKALGYADRLRNAQEELPSTRASGQTAAAYPKCLEKIDTAERRIKRTLRTQRAALHNDMSELSHRMDQDSFGLIPDRGIARVRWQVDLWLPTGSALIAFSLLSECVRNDLASIVRVFGTS